MTAPLRRWFTLALAPIVAVAIVAVPSMPADAAPKKPPAPKEDENPLLRDVLETVGRRYAEATAALKKSRAQQLRLGMKVAQAEARRDALVPQASRIAAQSYRTGKLNGLGFLLNSRDSNVFVQRATALHELNALNAQRIREYNTALAEVQRNKILLDQEVKQEQMHARAVTAQRREAQQALALVGGNRLTQGYVTLKSRKAAPAPRTADGGWPRESCSRKDPTTGGCVTPRTLHMYNEVRKAGFKRFVGCFRPSGPWEHPKGRACDWSLKQRGFSHASTPDMRRYGNNLMAFLVRNADRLGVLYVIWYRQIWFPATGWRPYSGPSAHTDHVHVSML